MPRVQVYLPESLYAELKSRDLPASELLQVAVKAEIERQDTLDATDNYLAELAAEVGEPSTKDRARARAIVRRIQDRQMHEAS
jgi:post-segregation antitoxin (ccd killing protein)